ncbi:MAG: hypothetical protein IPK19_14790 [Chloroflexi bacterium]|nr:hypothetical protein [Chloroflexota bacterium]
MDLIFVLGLAFLLTHELDAVERGEPAFFFGWAGLSEAACRRWFIAAHVPLFVVILASLMSSGLQIGLDIFLIVHAGLHLLLRDHPLIRFNTWDSQLWIFGAALSGAAHLVMR